MDEVTFTSGDVARVRVRVEIGISDEMLAADSRVLALAQRQALSELAARPDIELDMSSMYAELINDAPMGVRILRISGDAWLVDEDDQYPVPPPPRE